MDDQELRFQIRRLELAAKNFDKNSPQFAEVQLELGRLELEQDRRLPEHYARKFPRKYRLPPNSIGLARPIKRENWLNTDEAARYLGCSVKGLYKLIQRGSPYCPRYYQVTKSSPILFRQEWLDEFITSRSQQHQPVQPIHKGRKPKPPAQPLSPWWDDLKTGRQK